MSTVTRAAGCTVRIAAVTAATSVLADAVAAAATTKRREADRRPGMAGRAHRWLPVRCRVLRAAGARRGPWVLPG